MKFLSQNSLYVNNKCENFQGQNSHAEKDIQNLPTYVAMRIHFNTTDFDTLPRAEFSFIYHEIFGMSPSLH